MTSIEALIAEFERHASEAETGSYIYAEFEVDIAAMRALIASWRERGEALEKARRDIKWFKALPLMGLKDALKDKP